MRDPIYRVRPALITLSKVGEESPIMVHLVYSEAPTASRSFDVPCEGLKEPIRFPVPPYEPQKAYMRAMVCTLLSTRGGSIEYDHPNPTFNPNRAYVRHRSRHPVHVTQVSALDGRHNALLESPTGTGKTLRYASHTHLHTYTHTHRLLLMWPFLHLSCHLSSSRILTHIATSSLSHAYAIGIAL